MNIERLIEATRIIKPSHGWVYCEDESIGNDGFFDFDDLDYYLSDEKNKPCFVFDCDEDKWKGIDIDNAIENELEDWFEDVASQINFYEELESFIKQWNAKQDICQYIPNFTRIIVLDTDRFLDLIRNNTSKEQEND